MSNERIALGKKGERLVAQYLKTQGYTICEMNYSSKTGEIDIIAERGDVRIFVEVKLRSTRYFATSQVVTSSKQRKIILTARWYNSLHQSAKDWIYRFDIALLDPCDQDDYEITYIPNAFIAQTDWS